MTGTMTATTAAGGITPGMATMITVCGYGVCLFMGLLCAILLWFIVTEKINLTTLISEANGNASMSRFQLLIFTLVVAICMFILIERGTAYAFPEISQGVLTLLGISASTYAVGKGISYSRIEGVTTEAERAKMQQTAKDINATGARVDIKAGETRAGGAENPVTPPAPQP